MQRDATSLTSWARAIKAAVDAEGVDSEPLFAEAGLDMGDLNDPNARYPLAGTTKLWALAIAATQNENLGLSVARQTNQTTFHALGYSVLASTTLRECFETVVRYFRIVTDAGDPQFVQLDNGQYKYSLQPLDAAAQEASDAMMAIMIRLCRALAGRDFRAEKVVFRRPSPLDPSVFAKVFKAPLEFGCDETAIYFNQADMERPLATANAELARHNNQILVKYLAQLEAGNIVDRVHAALVDQLPHGEPSQEKIAASLHMSLRNLQRKLAEVDNSYKAILNQTREELAVSYMNDQQYSISEIAYLLGFADTSGFTRAFKRWTGQSPSDFRAQQN